PPAVARLDEPELAVDRVADRQAVPSIEERHAVVEGGLLVVDEDVVPGLPAIGGAIDAGIAAVADAQHDCGVGVERLHVTEIQVLGPLRADGRKRPPAVRRPQHGAVAAARPDHVTASHALPADLRWRADVLQLPGPI